MGAYTSTAPAPISGSIILLIKATTGAKQLGNGSKNVIFTFSESLADMTTRKTGWNDMTLRDVGQEKGEVDK